MAPLTLPMPANTTVPPDTPGPVPSLSARRVTWPPSALTALLMVTLLLAIMLSEPPPLALRAPLISMLLPARMAVEPPPSVVRAPSMTILRPASRLTSEPLPLAVMAAAVSSTTSFSAISLRPEPAVLAVIAALTSTSWPAFSSSVCGVVQVSALPTVMSFVAVITRLLLARLKVTCDGVSSPPASAIV